jgi:hypothetical protein
MTALIRTFINQKNGDPVVGAFGSLTSIGTNTPLAYSLVEGGALLRGDHLITNEQGQIKVWPVENTGFRLTLFKDAGTTLYQEDNEGSADYDEPIQVATEGLLKTFVANVIGEVKELAQEFVDLVGGTPIAPSVSTSVDSVDSVGSSGTHQTEQPDTETSIVQDIQPTTNSLDTIDTPTESVPTEIPAYTAPEAATIGTSEETTNTVPTFDNLATLVGGLSLVDADTKVATEEVTKVVPAGDTGPSGPSAVVVDSTDPS